MQEAKYYERGDGTTIKCLLCPHGCIISLNSSGKCEVRLNKNGRLYSENYGNATGIHLDTIEKKPLFHFYPGHSIVSIGTYGCNLFCPFCQNHHISHPHRIEALSIENYTPNEIIEISLNQKNSCGIAFTYNEPFIWYEYMYDIALLAKQKNLKNVVVSNGYINSEPLNELVDIVDAFNIDLKANTNEFYKNICGGSLKPVKQTLKTIFNRQKHLEITNLIIPRLNDDEKEFRKMVKWIAGELGENVPLHINRYFPAYRLNIEPTSIKTLENLKAIAIELLNFVYVGNVMLGGSENDTICPVCSYSTIRRNGYNIDLKGIDGNGNCTSCGFKIVIR